MQSAVLIYNPSLCAYLCCLQNGEIKFQKFPPNEASFSKATKLMIYGTFNVKKAITENDDVVFKFNETNYLMSELSLFCSWNGPNISQDSTWKLQRGGNPPLPDWFSTRPIISLNYLLQPDSLTQCLTKKDERKPIGSHNFKTQETYLIEDILFAMMSVEGIYIKRKSNSFEYQIEAHLEQTTCDLSLQQMIQKILPMCSQHDQIEHYILQKSKFEHGTVSQAFCSALKEMMQKYYLLVNQLDNEFTKGQLSLQKFWYFVQNIMRLIDAIYQLIQASQKQSGGTLLSTIMNFLNTNTDTEVIQTYEFLLQQSFIPYMKQLANWIYYGKIDDPFSEFLIQEKKIEKSSLENEYRDDYWDHKFTIRTNQIPKFLSQYSDIILRTGKYINVIGELAPPFDNYLMKNIQNIVKAQDFTHLIQCFEWANKQIIKLLFEKEKILLRLQSIKTFFLFDSGDFFIHFMEAAEPELIKDTKDISKEKLESLFDISIRSIASNDTYKDEMTCYLDQYTISEQIFAIRNLRGVDISENKPPRTQKLKGIDLFTLDMKVNWPANLILSRASLVNYQILFRSLFSLHYLEKQLNEAWLHQKSLKDTGMHQKFVKQCFLISRMQHLIKNYVMHIFNQLYYVSYDVIEKNYQILIRKIEIADNFEEVKDLHMKFSENCIKESLIIDQEFNKIFKKCIASSHQFSTQIQKQYVSLMSCYKDEPSSRRSQVQGKIKDLVSEQQFKTLCDTFIKNFDEAHRELIRLVKTQQYFYLSQYFIIENILSKLDDPIRFRVRDNLKYINMNQQHLSFSHLGQSLVQENRNAQDYLTLQLLNNYKSPQAFSAALSQNDRLTRQIEKQNHLIKQLYTKMSVADVNTENRNTFHSGHVSPFQVQQPLIQYMPPLPPPPVFFPQNFSFLQRQEMERQQQERLRMLILMKKLREENLELKMKLLANKDKDDNSYKSKSQSSVQESSRSSQQYKQQRRPNGPTAKDIEKEQAALQQMISKRAQMQLKFRCKRLILMMSFIRKIKQSIEYKSQEFKNKFPETILKFQEEIFKWMLSITGQVTAKLKAAKGLFLYLEPKTNPNEQKKRMDLLKTYTRNYIDVIFDNKETFPTFCKDYLLKFTHNYYVTPPNFLLKFELSRLTFTKNGGILMDKRKAQMMLMTIIFLRMYIQFISEIWEPVPAHSKAAEKNLNLQFQLNVQAICSSIHIIIVELLRGLVAVQPDNMKQIPVEYQPKAKQVYRVKNFNERDADKPKLESLKDLDEPLVYPLLDKEELKPFFVDNASVEMIKSVLEGWSEEMYEVIEQYRKDQIKERKKYFEENEKQLLMSQIQKIKEISGNALLLREQNNIIAEQREKIKEMKHFFNLPTKTNRNTSFEPSEQHQSSRRSKQS